jgi:ankyrin repeat protein
MLYKSITDIYPGSSPLLRNVIWGVIYKPFSKNMKNCRTINLQEAQALVLPTSCLIDPANLIMLAAARNNLVAVCKLAHLGFPVDLAKDNGGTALSIAVKHGFNELIDPLLKAGAEVFPPHSHESVQPVYLAAVCGNFEAIEKLSERKGMKETVCEWRTQDDMSLLDLALENGHEEFITKFIEKYGLDYTAISCKFLYVFGRYYKDSFNALIRKNPLGYYEASKIYFELDLAFFAAWTNNVELALMLWPIVGHFPYQGKGWSLIHIAARSGSREVIEFYLGCGVPRDLLTFEEPPRTAVDIAEEAGHVEIVELLKFHDFCPEFEIELDFR